MNVYDIAHNLARAIKNSEEYREYVEKQKKIFSNPSLKEMVLDFRQKAMEVQMAQMTGQQVDKEKIDNIKKLEGILMENPQINDFFMSEMRFSKMMNDIYKIIGESIDIDLGFEK